MKIEIIKSDHNNPVAEFFSSSSTPETDKFKIKLKTTCGEKHWVPVEHSERLERERDEALRLIRDTYDALTLKNGCDLSPNGVYSMPNRVRALECEHDEARDVLSEIALYLSVGMGDESTTAKQYYERILEGIKMLTDPLQDRIQTLQEMLDMQTKIVVDLEMRLMKNEQTNQI